MTGKIKAVLFDCDGLMFDTERISQQMFRTAAEKHGVSLPDDFFVRQTGGTSEEDRIYLHSLPGIEKVFGEVRGKRFDLDYWQSMAGGRLAKPGLAEIFAWLDEKKILRAVCSSSSEEYVRTLISTLGTPIRYDAIICGDTVSRRKPDPEIFLKAAEVLRVDPGACMVLEDSRQGLLAARRAGMHSCFIQDTIIPDEGMRSLIEYERKDLHEVIPLLEGLIQE